MYSRLARVDTQLPTLALCSSAAPCLDPEVNILVQKCQFDAVIKRVLPFTSKFGGIASSITLRQLRGHCKYSLLFVAHHSDSGQSIILQKFSWELKVCRFVYSFPFHQNGVLLANF